MCDVAYILCLWNDAYLTQSKKKKKSNDEIHQNLSNVVCLIAGEYGNDVINYFVVGRDTVNIIK